MVEVRRRTRTSGLPFVSSTMSSSGAAFGGANGKTTRRASSSRSSNRARVALAGAALVWCAWSLLLRSPSSSSSSSSSLRALPSRRVAAAAEYGPERPRAVAVICGDDAMEAEASVRSLFARTEHHGVLDVAVVLNGVEESDEVRETVERARHDGATEEDEGELAEIKYYRKVWVLFRKEMVDVNECRSLGVESVRRKVNEFEQLGLKTKEEDPILLFLTSGTELTRDGWLDAVSTALVVPEFSTRRPVDAVSLLSVADVSSPTVPAFDAGLNPVRVPVNTNDADRDSFPVPLLHGAAFAMRFSRWGSILVRDSLSSELAADVELSLNLWLCGDGVRALRDVRVSVLPSPDQEMSDLTAARIAAVWMDDVRIDALYDARQKAGTSLKVMEKHVQEVKSSPSFPRAKVAATSCKNFDWYVENVNKALKGTGDDGRNTNKKKTGFVLKTKTRIADASELKKDPPAPPKKQPPPKKKDLHGRVLSPDKLQILSTAKPVDLTYVPITDRTSHPHMGAADEHGEPGYVHDATALRNNPPLFVDPDLKRHCTNREGNYLMLTERVVVHKEDPNREHKVKLFCTVFAVEKVHQTKIPTIRNTWGQKCDGFMVGSTATDPSLNTVSIPHEGPEEYQNIWQKMRSIWSYVYDNYYEDYDWFHVGGDDLYVIVENLRAYLESDEIRLAARGGRPDGTPEGTEKPLFLGRRFKEGGNAARMFNSGGSGYTLNKAALKLMVVTGFPISFPHLKTFAEDVMVATVFRKQGVFPYETKDEEGSERYMPFSPAHHFTYRLPADVRSDWYANYSINIREGIEHCSKNSVAFHYIAPDLMMKMHAILYGHCAEYR